MMCSPAPIRPIWASVTITPMVPCPHIQRQSTLLKKITPAAAPALTGNQINMTRGVTSQSVINYNLHMTILWVCIVIGVIVFSAMFVSIVLHRKSRGHEAAKFTHSTKA